VAPLYVALIPINPVAEESTVAVKFALSVPWGTSTVAGTVTPGALLERATVTSPAALDIVTVQVVLVPAVGFVVRHPSDDTAGVDHSVRVADCDDVPRVAVTVALVSAGMPPMPALNVPVELPALITIEAGTVTTADDDPRVTVVLLAADCDSVAVHELVAPDMAPDGVHTSDVTTTAALKEMDAVCEEPL